MSEIIHGTVSAGGRVVLPAEFRKACRLEEGDEVIFSRNELGIQITTMADAIQHAQQLTARFIPAGVNLAAALREARRQDKTFD